MAEQRHSEPAVPTNDGRDQLWVGRYALLLVTVAPVVFIGCEIATGLTNNEIVVQGGGLIALMLWLAGAGMGVATRATLAGRIAMWFGIGLPVLVVAAGLLLLFQADTSRIGSA